MIVTETVFGHNVAHEVNGVLAGNVHWRNEQALDFSGERKGKRHVEAMSYVPVQEVIEGVGIVDCSLVVTVGEGCIDLW
jgi:hypothetical protein